MGGLDWIRFGAGEYGLGDVIWVDWICCLIMVWGFDMSHGWAGEKKWFKFE